MSLDTIILGVAGVTLFKLVLIVVDMEKRITKLKRRMEDE